MEPKDSHSNIVFPLSPYLSLEPYAGSASARMRFRQFVGEWVPQVTGGRLVELWPSEIGLMVARRGELGFVLITTGPRRVAVDRGYGN